MLSKFFPALQPKEYAVQVLRDNTSQSAVKRIKRTRTSAPFKKIATLALVLSFIGGGLASASAATAVTAKQAQANVIADMVCIKADADNSGAWNGGANVYGVIGGRPAFNTNGVSRNTPANDEAYRGTAGSWGNAPGGGQYVTAYEKYGLIYPVYDSWVPVYSDKKVTIKQVDSHSPTGTYSTADGKLPVKGGNDLESGASPLVTSDIGSCMAVMPSVSASIANMISSVPRFVMGASLELYTTAYGSSISNEQSVLYGIGKSIDKFITNPGGLKDSLFIPFIMPLLLIGAIWVGYVGVVKRAAIQAVQSTGWMILAIALGTFFLAQPTLISSYVDKSVAEVQRIVNGAVLDNAAANEMCNLDGSGDPQATIRETKCTIWQSTIYTTWVAGQFGEGAAQGGSAASSVLKQEAGRDVLGNNDYKVYYGSKNGKPAETWPQFMLDRQVTNKTLEQSEVAWAQLSGAGGAKINSEWSGGMGMISSAILMFVGAGASSAVLFVYGFTLLIYQLMMISAVLMSPFFFLFGIVPNWGRRVLMRYAEILVSLAVKRIVTGTLLTFYLLFYNLIVGEGSFNLLIVKMMIIFALALFFITSRAKFVNMFADNINFGGNKSVGLPGNKAAAITAGLGVGLLGGGILGGAVVAHKTRKSNKDIEGNVKNIKLEGGNPTADIKTPPRGPNSGSPNSGGGAGDRTVNPVKVAGQAVNGVEDAKRAKDLVDNFRNSSQNSTPSKAPQAPQSAANGPTVGATPNGPATAAQGAPMPPTANSAAATQAAGKAASTAGGTGGAGTTVAPAAAGKGGMSLSARFAATGTPTAGAAGSTAASAGGAGATVVPAAASGSAGIISGGAAATGSAGAATGTAGVAAGGAAATGAGAAAGSAAVAGGGAVAAGAAAGSVVPVVGTAVGAAAAAAVVAAKQKQNKGGDKE